MNFIDRLISFTEERAEVKRDEHHKAIYDILTSNGPDVDMYSKQFGALAGKIVKLMGGVDKVMKDYTNNKGRKIYQHLDKLGMFGRKSDNLRSLGDKYY